MLKTLKDILGQAICLLLPHPANFLVMTCNVHLMVILVNFYLKKLFAPNLLFTAVCRQKIKIILLETFFIFCISILLETLSDLIITYEVLYNHKKISFLLTKVLFVRVTEALISCLILSFIEAIYFNIFIIYVFRLLIEEKI
jgi:hypothetical protein